MNSPPSLAALGLYFLTLSLMAVGGANGLIPDMHRQLVEIRGWMSGPEFITLVALSQAAPGPNVLLVSLIGWKMFGLSGALLAIACMCVPSGLVTFFFAQFWLRFQQARWRAAAQAGLASLSVGLVVSSGYVLTRVADHDWITYGITAITAVLSITTKIHPLWLLGASGLLGLSELVS